MIDLFEYVEQCAARGMAAACAKEKGMRESAEHAGHEWQAEAMAFLHGFLERNNTMFCDELWDAGLPEPESSRALGSIMLFAARQGWMEQQRTESGDIIARPSIRSNGQLKAVWKSNICTQ